MIFWVKFNPYVPPKIDVSSIFSEFFFYKAISDFDITPILWNTISWGWPLNTGLTVHKFTHFQNVVIENLFEIKTPFVFQRKGDNRINYKDKETLQQLISSLCFTFAQ